MIGAIRWIQGSFLTLYGEEAERCPRSLRSNQLGFGKIFHFSSQQPSPMYGKERSTFLFAKYEVVDSRG